jgi:hypothetical protein
MSPRRATVIDFLYTGMKLNSIYRGAVYSAIANI